MASLTHQEFVAVVPLIYSIVRKRLRNATEDDRQDTLVDVLEALRRYRGDRPIGVVVRASYQSLWKRWKSRTRKKRSAPRSEFNPFVHALHTDEEDCQEDEHTRNRISIALSLLDPETRKWVVDYYWTDKTMVDIANEHHSSKAAVHARIKTALKMCREILELLP